MECIYLEQPAHKEPYFPLFNPFNRSSDKLQFVNNGFTENELRHLNSHLVEPYCLIASDQKFFLIPRRKLRIPIRPENPIIRRIHIDLFAVIHPCCQLSDWLRESVNRVVNAELIRAVHVNLAATRTVKQ